MRYRDTVALLLALAPAAGMTQAASLSPRIAQKVERRFEAADTNHDGKLTLAEARAGMPRIASYFNRIDTDGKGYVTLDQVERFVAQMRAAHGD